MLNKKSKELYEKACKLIPGGVNSPVRAFRSVESTPVFIKKGEGAYLYDIDNNKYIDYVASWGPMILGHAHPQVIEAVCKALEKGTSFGAPTKIEIDLADLISQSVPSIESLRLVNSGTEATMSAIRLARAYTKKDKIIKFEGCYHGHADSFLIKAGSGAMTFGYPSSPGVTKGTAQDTLIASYNDIKSVEELFDANKDTIAAIIVEPIPANMGLILPNENFLNNLRTLADKYNSLLIFDEVISGFRVAIGGAQAYYNVTPDLTTLGKIIGGGLPIGAYGGKREIMSLISPDGPVYQAGTLSGNPIAVTAGLETLKIITSRGVIEEINQKTTTLINGIKKVLTNKGISLTVNSIASIATLFFTNQPVDNYKTAALSNTAKYATFFNKMLDRGIYFAPSQFEVLFVSLSHGENEINQTITNFEAVISEL